MDEQSHDPMEIIDEIERLERENPVVLKPRKQSIPDRILDAIVKNKPHYQGLIAQIRGAQEEDIPILEKRLADSLGDCGDYLSPIDIFALMRCCVGDPCSEGSSMIGEIMEALENGIIPHRCEVIEEKWADKDFDHLLVPVELIGRDISSKSIYRIIADPESKGDFMAIPMD